MKLNEVKLNQSACIDKISADFAFSKRLMELGFYKGAEITPVFTSLVKGSRAYEICGTVVALRDTVAKNVDVTLISGGKYEEG